MVFDSRILASALVLFAAALLAWHLAAPLRAGARLHLRFGAILLAALAVCAALGLADVAVLFLLPLSSAALALAALGRFTRIVPVFLVSLALVAALGCGLGATISGQGMLALWPAVIAALGMVAAGLRGVSPVTMLSGIAVLAAALALLAQGFGAGVMLFCAAALVGAARSQPLRSTSMAVRGAGAS